ncbi:MAG TPA: efflux RND transporter periplasmic adaptor subunit [Candidatus Acidoferrum sp.]|nr:efflux RND transporter periplasmic adaptor subunit [Candidatus Acidoferrum sp.]
MKNYRTPFLIVLIANLVLIAAFAGYWWSSHPPVATNTAVPASTPAPKQDLTTPSTPPPSAETPLSPIQLSPERLQSIGVKFGVVERKDLKDTIRTTGTVAIDERRVSYVQTRISGHIERVFADATYQYVKKGQPLFTLHSPELITAEREYLLARQNANNLSQSSIPGVATGVSSLLDSSRERLAQWDISPQEISRLETTGQVEDTLTIQSPVSGYITERTALPNMMVQLDTRLYTIADLSTVWVLAQIFQNDLGRIKAGSPATLTIDSYPGRVFRGRVDFIYPDVDMTTRTARARLVFANPQLTLSPGMFVNVSLDVNMGKQLTIPVGGVLQSGSRQIVFVDRGSGYLDPREVQLGPQANDEYVVLKGLKAGERIATSANFLIDSESQLQAAIGSYVPPPPGAGGAAAMNPSAAQSSAQIEFSTLPATPHKGANLYRVKLTASGGSPLTGAQISVRSYMAGMPEMGMAAMNVVTPLAEKGNGVYEGQVTLDSGGTWKITVTATKNGAALATKQLSLQAEGGM